MIGWIFRGMSWKSFGLGAGTAVVGGYVVRPMLVSTVSGGLKLRNFAVETWNQLRSEATKVVEEGGKLHLTAQEVEGLMAEFMRVRDDVGFVKGKLSELAVL